ncbi:MAG: NRDE family protein [Tistlia sp.]|uniref:NRDE family protein n=1 Tax=Tistlia sp. TaxID=3057121 RepID=UPI0034A305BB
MCTLVLLRRPEHDWPLILGANRDEMVDRPSRPPGRHWPDRPEVVGGLDALSGGSWLAMNDQGVLAAVLNRRGSLGPAAGKRSRGELALEALDHAEAAAAAWALGDLDPGAYRSFNLVIADERDAFWLRNRGEEAEGIEVMPLPRGLNMLTAFDLNDPVSPRIRSFLPRFETAPAPEPATGDWSAWQALLAARSDEEGVEEAAMTVIREDGFGTLSSSLVALPSVEGRFASPPVRPVWLFADGRPGETPYRPVGDE